MESPRIDTQVLKYVIPWRNAKVAVYFSYLCNLFQSFSNAFQSPLKGPGQAPDNLLTILIFIYSRAL